MNINFSQIRNNLANPKWNYYSLILIAFMMPFYLRFLPYLIALASITWLLQKDIPYKLGIVLRSKYAIVFFIFFLLHLIGLLYTDDLNRGLFNVQVKLSLFAFPIIFIGADNYIIKRKEKIITAFVFGNIFFSIICLLLSTYNSFQNGQNGLFNISVYSGLRNWSPLKLILSGYSYYNYSFLSHFIHVSYFSMYILMAAYFVYNRMQQRWSSIDLKVKIKYITMVVFFLIMIFLLQSRACFLALLAVIFFEVIRQLIRPGRIVLRIGVAIILLGIISGSIYKSKRFTSLKQGISNMSVDQLENKELRLLIWKHSIPIIKQNLLFGVGTGDVNKESLKHYTERLKELTKGKYYNFHNEFIETMVRLGIPGEVTLWILLFIPFMERKNYINKNNVFLVFLIIIISNFSFETMLNRLNGVVFFSVFYSFYAQGIRGDKP